MNRVYLALQQLQNFAESTANKGVADGYASLDATGNVPATQLGNVEGMEVHDITGAYHSATGLTAGHFMKALTATTFGFEAHGLTAADVSALALAGGVMSGTIDMAAYQLYLNTPGTYPYSYVKGTDGDVLVNGAATLKLGIGTSLKMLIETALTTMYQNVAMNDNSITGVDTITFTDVNGTIAGIENQNLVDKSAAETISGLWTFGTNFPITPSSAPTSDYQVANKAYVDLMIPLAQRDAVGGVAILDSNGHILSPGSNIMLTRDGSDIIRIQDRTSSEDMIYLYRAAESDIEAYIPEGGVDKRVVTEGNISSFVSNPISSGTYADRPVNPKPGDMYICTDEPTVKILYCQNSGEWNSDGIKINGNVIDFEGRDFYLRTGSVAKELAVSAAFGLIYKSDGVWNEVYHEGNLNLDTVKLESYAQVSNGVFRRLVGTSGTSTFKKLNSADISGSTNKRNVYQSLKTYNIMLGDIFEGNSSLYCHGYEGNGYATARILVNGVVVATGSRATNSYASAVTPVSVGDTITYQVSSALSTAPTLREAAIRGDIETININTYA